jgi:hypothetical protein
MLAVCSIFCGQLPRVCDIQGFYAVDNEESDLSAGIFCCVTVI